MRDFAPVVDNIAPRDRASQTLLARQAVCPRSAYLHVRHGGGPGSHEMHRGSAFHEFAATAINWLVDADEHQLPWEVGKDLVAEVVARNPGWVITPSGMDELRLAAFHWCECTVIEPDDVLAVERLFELELGGMRVRGKVDAGFAAGKTLALRDYKTQVFVPSQEEIDEKLQLPLYALLVAEGRPVKQERCGYCDGAGQLVPVVDDDGGVTHVPLEPGAAIPVEGDPREIVPVSCFHCDGGWVETPLAPIGSRFDSFEVDEVYPRLEPWSEGTGKVLAYRRRTFDRRELVDQRLYVEGLVAKFAHGVATGDWPAVPGSHCATCAAAHECPIPAVHREGMGALLTLEDASRAGESIVVEAQALTARRAALREFSKAHGGCSIPVGPDLEFGFATEETEEWITGKKIGRPTTADAKAAMLAGIQRAIDFGEEFDLAEYRRTRRSSRFDKRKVKASGQEAGVAAHDTTAPPSPAVPPKLGVPAESDVERQARLDEEFGKDAPF